MKVHKLSLSYEVICQDLRTELDRITFVYNLFCHRYCINRMKEEDEDFVNEHSLFALLWSTDSWVME